MLSYGYSRIKRKLSPLWPRKKKKNCRYDCLCKLFKISGVWGVGFSPRVADMYGCALRASKHDFYELWRVPLLSLSSVYHSHTRICREFDRRWKLYVCQTLIWSTDEFMECSISQMKYTICFSPYRGKTNIRMLRQKLYHSNFAKRSSSSYIISCNSSATISIDLRKAEEQASHIYMHIRNTRMANGSQKSYISFCLFLSHSHTPAR